MVRKFQEKLEKCRKEVELSRDNYKSALDELNAYNGKYVEEMVEVFSKTQEFEGKRLAFVKKLLFDVHSCLDLSRSQQLVFSFDLLLQLVHCYHCQTRKCCSVRSRLLLFLCYCVCHLLGIGHHRLRCVFHISSSIVCPLFHCCLYQFLSLMHLRATFTHSCLFLAKVGQIITRICLDLRTKNCQSGRPQWLFHSYNRLCCTMVTTAPKHWKKLAGCNLL